MAGVNRDKAVFNFMMDCYVGYLETAFSACRMASAHSGRMTRAHSIVDASGVSLSTMANVRVIKEVAKIGTSYYPEIMRKVTIVNMPWAFAAVWKLVAPLLPEQTRQKVAIYGSDFLPSLLDDIDEADLPAFLGGKKDDAELSVPRAAPIPAESRIGGFAIGCQAYSFNRFTLFEAIEKTELTGSKVIEFFPGQALSPDQRAVKWDHNAGDDVIATVKAKLAKHGIRAVNYGVVGVPKDEAGARKIFEFAKKMELYAITTESTESIDTIEKLVKEFDVRVGYHNHPVQPKNPNYKVWDPNYILASVKRPVDSITMSTPNCFHGSSAGLLALTTWISWPLTTSTSSSALSGLDFLLVTVPENRPWVESYLTR